MFLRLREISLLFVPHGGGTEIIMIKKILSFFITAVMLVSLVPPVFAEDGEEGMQNLVLYGDFEDEEEAAKYFGGGMIDSAAAFEGRNGIQVSNPYGGADDSVMNHVLEYLEPVVLTAGEFYTFSAYVLNPMSDYVTEPKASASLGSGDALFIDVTMIGGEWSYVSVSFMAMEDGEYSLSVMFEGGDTFVGFFVDSVSITASVKRPAYAALAGNDEVFVPDTGCAIYRYGLVTYDDDEEPINVLIRDLSITIENLPDGVEFDETTGILRVWSDAPPNASFSLICTASVGIPLREGVKEITTTKNLLSDPYFEEGLECWESEDSVLYADGCISLYASNKGPYGYYASAVYTNQLILTEGKMYVFRADVKSTEEFSASDVYISNTSFASSGYAEINITGIGGGEWTSVVSAFTVERSGVYELTLNLCAPSERPVCLDNVSLGIETSTPTRLSLHAPGNIQIPSESVTLPCYALLHDQMGQVIFDADIDIDISPKRDGVSLSGGEITVTSSARADEYLITASCGSLTGEIYVSVSYDAVGDGGFEEKEANEWWAASDGAMFSIVDYGDNLWGYVFSEDCVCLVVNNSYMELLGGEYYVYSASAGVGRSCTVTAFIADAFSGEYIPISRYNPLSDVKEPFILEESVVGRLVLYIDSDESVALTMDDISIFPAELYANDVYILGGEEGGTLRGYYSYNNNMTDSADADISAVRWYISPESDGRYEPLGAPNQSYLEYTEDMDGQYIVFEVTPVCSVTGLVGESVRSEPVRVGGEKPKEDTPASVPPLAPLKPIELENTNTHPFSDIIGHWAEPKIASLCTAGIVTGRSSALFVPEENVTRAEFTAMVTRAFSLVSLPYSGEFSDVSQDDWFSGAVEAAFKRSLVTGLGDKIFSPSAPITREQMASIIYRAYLASGGEAPPDFELLYHDSHTVSLWALEAVKGVSTLGFFSGTDANLFEPERNATRAEAAAVIYRVLKYLT